MFRSFGRSAMLLTGVSCCDPRSPPRPRHAQRGTSAVAGLLVRLGAQGPKTLLPADPDNPAGYCESAVFYELHERVLRAAGSRWDAFTRLEPERLRLAMPDDLSNECRGALHAEFGDAPRFVLKGSPDVPLRAVLAPDLGGGAYRACGHPGVAEPSRCCTVTRREKRLRAGPLAPHWLRHVLDAEHDTRAVRRTFVRYQELLENWTSVAERFSQDLQSPWPTKSVVDDAEIDRFVSHRLCHHHGDPDIAGVAPVLSDWTRRAWTALGWLHDRDPSRTAQAFGTLDAIRAEFDRNTLVLGDVRDRIHQSLRTQIDRVERELDRVEREQRALREHTAGLEAVRDGLQHRIEALEREAGVLRQELSAAQGHADALRKSASWRVTAPLRRGVPDLPMNETIHGTILYDHCF